MTAAEIQTYIDKCDTAKAKAQPMLAKVQAGNQPTEREIAEAKAAFDALVAEGLELW
jgi:hypothetical protein